MCCICTVGELCNKMDIDTATDAIKEEHLPVEETDDSCVFKYIEIVPLATAGPYASLHLAPDRQPRQHHTTQVLQTDALPAAQPTASKH